MAKGKPRHNPDKPQNKYGSRCPYAEEMIWGGFHCEAMLPGNPSTRICNGNRHNCVKTLYRWQASRSDGKKNNEYREERMSKGEGSYDED